MAATETVQESVAIPTGTWKSDPIHSHIGFSVKHMVVATFRGAFGDYKVTLSDESGEPRISGEVGVSSIEVKDEALQGHLLSPDFFDAERYPEISFNSSSIRVEGDEIVVAGELNIKGTTKQVEALGTITQPIEDPAGGLHVGLDISTNLDRREFGLNWNADLPKGGAVLSNDVKLEIHIELAKDE
jgi:polyisoprenoid-binding protein YceI